MMKRNNCSPGRKGLYFSDRRAKGEKKDMDCKIVTIPGDGIGPEIVREACKVLDKIGQVFGHSFQYTEILMGGCSIDA